MTRSKFYVLNFSLPNAIIWKSTDKVTNGFGRVIRAVYVDGSLNT